MTSSGMSRAGRKARTTAVAVLALLAAGLPTAAHAADAESITGTITLPQGIDVDETYADT